MKIAVLSGKGGTGKTFVSLNLHTLLLNSIYIDADVEEPNGFIFLCPNDIKSVEVKIKEPKFDLNKCIGCSKCVDFCKFNAIALINKKPIVFKDVCHSCGGCKLVCPVNAISEEDISIGKVNKGISNINTSVYSGLMNIGQTSGSPIIKELLKINNNLGHTIIDCPPGSGCMVSECVRDSDYCLIVADPTIYGCANMDMVVKLAKNLKKPFGVVLNKCTEFDNPSFNYCLENNINILGKIPFDNKVHFKISSGEIVSLKNIEFKNIFNNILLNLMEVIK